jgi:hypothetical protein
MVETEVLNDTGGELSLKEGNAGVYRVIKKLPPKAKHVFQIDPNATYREYEVTSSPSGEKVFVTSDDCIDYSTITIFVDKDGVFKYTGKSRSETKEEVEGAPGSLVSRLLKKIWSFWPWKK